MKAANKHPNPMQLSIVIPAYNEEERIGPTLERIISFLEKEKNDAEIVVVNDGSWDRTVNVVASFMHRTPNLRLISNPSNRGKGYTVKHGIEEAKGELILFSDADLSTPIEDYKTLAHFTDEYDVIIGSRALPGSKVEVHQPFYREFMGKFFNFLVQHLVLYGLKDTQCGFKLFRRSIAQEVIKRQTFDGFCFDVEFLYIARMLGARIKEVPVQWYNSPATRVHVIKDSWKMFWDLMRIRKIHRSGRLSII